MTHYNLVVDGDVVYQFESDCTPAVVAVPAPKFGDVYTHADYPNREARFLGYNNRGDWVFATNGECGVPTMRNVSAHAARSKVQRVDRPLPPLANVFVVTQLP